MFASRHSALTSLHLGDAGAEEEIAGDLRAALRAPWYRPPLLPSSAFRLLELARKQETTFRDLLGILQSDPFVAGQVLRVAGSPLYARGEPVRSLEQALTRLGITALTQIFLQVTVTSRVFRAPGYAGPMESLREHAVATAHAARLICRNTRLPDDVAFLCGLLHDVGAAMSLIVLGDLPPHRRPLYGESVVRAIDAVRVEAATVVCESWGLPSDLLDVIVNHHEPFSNGNANPLGCVVLLADHLATLAGFGGVAETFHGVELAQTSLGISEAAWRLLVADFRALGASFS